MSQVFIEQIKASLAVWEPQLIWGQDSAITLLDDKKNTVWQTIAWGLSFSETFYETGEFVSKLYPLIERRNHWEEGISLIQSVTEKLDKHDPLFLRLENQRGCLYRLLLQLNDAIHILTSVRELAIAAGNLYEKAEAEMYLALCAYQQGRFDDAIQFGNQAFESFRQDQKSRFPDDDLVPPRKKAAIHNVVGLSYQDKGDVDASLPYFLSAIDAYIHTEDYSYLATVQMNYARCLINLKQYEQGEVAATEALNSAELAQNALLQSQILVIRAIGYIKSNRLEQALADLKLANSSQVDQSSNDWLKATIKSNLGNCYLKMGKPEKAIQWLKESISHWHQTEDQIWTGDTYCVLAKSYALAGDKPNAALSAQKAIDLLTPFAHLDIWQEEIDKVQELIGD